MTQKNAKSTCEKNCSIDKLSAATNEIKPLFTAEDIKIAKDSTSRAAAWGVSIGGGGDVICKVIAPP